METPGSTRNKSDEAHSHHHRYRRYHHHQIPHHQYLRSPPQQANNNHGLNALNFIIILSLISIFLLFAVVLVIFLLRKVKSTENNEDNINKNKNTEERLRKISTDSTSILFGASPDVKNKCFYGGALSKIPSSTRLAGVQVFTYREIELATNSFCEENIIGNGRFGVVYKGILSDGSVVAVKKLNVEGKQGGDREFRFQVDLFSKLHSSYIVGLLGYCADQNHRVLVSEFISNGSLQEHLHSSNKLHQPLNWGTRLRIALDCARALEFLHEYAVPSIIHRDFKCSNIVLDHNFRAKVSDLGLAKTVSGKINGEILMQVSGTNTGYLAPEYTSTGQLSTKSDVYSYGVVLLELITGRKPIDTDSPPGEHILVSWALPRLTNREKVVEMVDPALQGQFSKKELIQIAAIAAVCVQQEADYRPLMTDVVQSLIPLVKNHSTSFPSNRFHSRTVSPSS